MNEKIDLPPYILDRRETARKLHGDRYEEVTTPARIAIREMAREKNISLLDALFALCPEGTDTQMVIAFSAALADVVEGGEQTVEQKLVEALNAAPVPDKKDKRKHSAKPKKGQVGWANQIGKKGILVQIVPPEGVDLVAWLEKQLGIRKFYGFTKEHVEGAVLPDANGMDVDFADQRHRWLGDHIACFGWRVDRRSVAAGTLKLRLAQRVRTEGRPPGKAAMKALKDEEKDKLLEQAIPATSIAVCVVDLTDGWMLWGGDLAGLKEFSQNGPNIATLRIESGVEESRRARLGLLVEQTDLRKEPLLCPSSNATRPVWTSFAWCDFLLWLAIPQDLGNKVAWTDTEGVERDATWKLNGPVLLGTKQPDGKVVEVAAKGSSAAALSATLAEGGCLKSIRLEVEESWEVAASSSTTEDGAEVATTVSNSRTYHITLSVKKDGLEISGIGLPAGGWGSPFTIAWERMQLIRRLWEMIGKLADSFALARCVTWDAFVDHAKGWLGMELHRRFVFDTATGQGWLFKLAPPAPVPVIEEKQAKPARKSKK